MDSFQQKCAAATLQNIDEILKPFLTTWSTSLVGSDLAQLKSLSEDNRLRHLVDTLVIEDDCAKLDPWMTGDVPEVDTPHHVWPRNNTGIVSEGEVDAGISHLAHILRNRLLCPTKIQIRDHQIQEFNFRLCPEMARVRELIHVARSTAHITVSVNGLAKSIAERSNIAVSRLAMRSDDMGFSSPVSWDLLVSKLGGFVSLATPKLDEVTIELSKEHEAQETTFSSLRSADILLKADSAAYWLEQVFYNATNLETLSLSVKEPPDQWPNPDRVVPTLRKFTLRFRTTSQTTISAEELLTMIASSKESLTHISLRSISLTGSSWRDVLSFIAKEYHKLGSFDFDRLREAKPEEDSTYTLDFGDARDHLSEEHHDGLNLIEKGRLPHKPVGSLTYDGPKARVVLEALASQGKPGVFRRVPAGQ